MNWEAIGAIGESVGAAAVVVSLVYLAIQIRQGSALTRLNTKAMHARAYQDLVDHHASIHLKVATHADLRRTVMRGRDLGVDDMSDEERVQYGSFTSQQVRSYYTGFNLYEQGLIDEAQWQSFSRSIALMTQAKAFRDWWQQRGDLFPEEFARVVESYLND